MAAELSWIGTARRVDRPTRRRDDRDGGHHGCGAHEPGRSNEALIDRCRSGDFGAWNELVTRYERLVYAIPIREGLGTEDAAEVSQAAFETLVQSLDRIRDPERLGHWLMTVTRRLTWRRRRERRDEVSVEVSGLESAAPATDPDWERTVDIYETVLELDDPCRSLIFGLFFDPAEPSYDELARVLGMAVGSIGPLRGRCLSRLRSMLEEGAA